MVVFSFVDLPSALVMLKGKPGPRFLPINLYLSIFIDDDLFSYVLHGLEANLTTFLHLQSRVVLCGR